MQSLEDRLWWYSTVKKKKNEPAIEHFYVPDTMRDALCVFSFNFYNHYNSHFQFQGNWHSEMWNKNSFANSHTSTQTHAWLTWAAILLTTKFSFTSNKRITSTFVLGIHPRPTIWGLFCTMKLHAALCELMLNTYAILAYYIPIHLW